MKDRNDWHLLPKEKVLRILSSDAYKGLVASEVRKRRRRFGANTVWSIKRTSPKDAALSVLFDLASVLLIICAAAAALFEKSAEAGMITIILAAAGFLRAVTYIRANRILEKNAREKIPVISVIRSGNLHLVRADEIVPGDIIILEPGDVVPCDARVLSGDDAVVSEKRITENRSPVHKFDVVIETDSAVGEVPCEFRSNMIFAGSVVISGFVRAVAVATGDATLLVMKRGPIVIDPTDKLPTVEKLKSRAKNVSLIMLAFVMLITAFSLFNGKGFTLPEVFLGAMAMAVAAMSEYITTIGYIIIAVSIKESSEGGHTEKTFLGFGKNRDRTNEKTARGASRETLKRNATREADAVIRCPELIEKIADTGCIIFCGSSYFKSPRAEVCGFYADGKMCDMSDARDIKKAERIISYAGMSALSLEEKLSAPGMHSDVRSENEELVESALCSFLRITGRKTSIIYPVLEHKNKDESRSMLLDTSLIAKDGREVAVCSGKIEDVIRACEYYETKDGVKPLSEQVKKEIFTECARLEIGGANIVAVSMRISPFESLNRIAVITQYMTFMGFIALSAEGDSGITENVAEIKKAGVVPVLFSEDPMTDLYYCNRFKLFNKKTKIIHYSLADTDISDNLTPDGIIVDFSDCKSDISMRSRRAVEEIKSAFKKKKEADRNADHASDKLDYGNKAEYAETCDTVDNGIWSKNRAEHSDGCTVAAVGRRVCDAASLSEADIGFAVSSSEYRPVPEALSSNSCAVIYPAENQKEQMPGNYGGFSGVIRAVSASKRAVGNVSSAAFYLMASQTARLVVMLAAVLFGLPLLSPVFILIWGLLFDFAASIVMSFEDTGKLSGNKTDPFFKKSINSVICGSVWGVLCSALIPLIRFYSSFRGNGVSDGCILSVLSASLILGGISVSCETMRRGSILTKEKINTAYAAFAACGIVFSVILMFTSFGAGIAHGEKAHLFSLFSVIPPIILIVLFEMCKYLYKHDEYKNSKNSQIK